MLDRYEAHKNALTFSDEIGIDVPPEFTPIEVYRASLGHKVMFGLKTEIL